MAKTLAFLEYTFIFEPGAETWTRGMEFEKDLADFLAAHKLDADVVNTVGGTGRRVLYISSMEKLDKMRQDEPQKGVQKALSNAMKQAQQAGKEKKK